MRFVSVQETNIDFPGKQAMIVFTPKCNYRCPTGYCHGMTAGEANVDEEQIYEILKKRAGWVDGVVVCGGEPTLQHRLPNFLENVKKLGLSTKLDTNGSNYQMIGKLIQEKLIDYIAMDIKAPSGMYKKIIGLKDEDRFDLRDDVEKGIYAVQSAPAFEFRTTVVPIFNPDLRWFTQQEARDMAEWVKQSCPYDLGKWYVQPFVAQEKGEMIDERFGKENLPQEFRRTPREKLEEIAASISECGFKARVR